MSDTIKTRLDFAFETLGSAYELARMIHGHHAGQVMDGHPGELDQPIAEAVSMAVVRLIGSALTDLEPPGE